MDVKPPNIERPRAVEALAPGYERVHREAVARIRKLTPEDRVAKTPIPTLLWRRRGRLQARADDSDNAELSCPHLRASGDAAQAPATCHSTGWEMRSDSLHVYQTLMEL
jgi:hypothetical protein